MGQKVITKCLIIMDELLSQKGLYRCEGLGAMDLAVLIALKDLLRYHTAFVASRLTLFHHPKIGL